jgi:hypothetical protein
LPQAAPRYQKERVRSGTSGSNGEIDAAIDAPPDGIPATCNVAGERACDGRVRRTCGSDQQWDPALDVTCNFTCVAGDCIATSNVPLADVATCEASAPALSPPPGAVVEVRANGIACAPHCGDGTTTVITPTILTAPTPDLAWFCLASIDLIAGVDVALPATGGPAQAVALVVDGPVSIASRFDFDGKVPTAGAAGGEGGPGAFDGGARSNVDGTPGGGGTCGGAGGVNQGSNPNEGGGGGGGAGGASIGGPGGTGAAPNGTQIPGGGGGGTCATAELVPLVGGAGGGSGGDGSCSSCGWAGGGGGGAIQISSRAGISITGTLRAHGGAGFGITSGTGSTGGGGGGGAGGGILLEAPSITITGTLGVDGGAGGSTNAGPGGLGATGANGPQPGTSFSANDQGGAGGGGAGGRIRIVAPNASCANASPAASCTTANLAGSPN